MGLTEAARFCCFIIEFVMLHCNNVSRVFPIHSMHVRGVISDWRLIPVCDWLVCLPLVWFFTGSFGGVPFLFHFCSNSCGGSIFVHLDALFFRCVLLCFLGCQYCTSEGLCVLALVI